MWKWVLMILATLSLLLNGCAAGELSQSIATAVSGGIDEIIRLEEAGIDHDSEIYLPFDFEVDWTPFGAKVRMVGGYMRSHAGTGRGLGVRPPDIAGRPLPGET